MKKFISIIYFAVLFAAAIGILFWIAKPDKNSPLENQSANIDLAVDESFFDFGNISMAAGIVSHEFKVKNTSASDTVISQLYTSCMCTTASLTKGNVEMGPFGMPGHGPIPKINSTIGAGEEAIIRVEFDPAAHGPAGVGPVDRVVYVVQKGISKPLELQFKAVVSP